MGLQLARYAYTRMYTALQTRVQCQESLLAMKRAPIQYYWALDFDDPAATVPRRLGCQGTHESVPAAC